MENKKNSFKVGDRVVASFDDYTMCEDDESCWTFHIKHDCSYHDATVTSVIPDHEFEFGVHDAVMVKWDDPSKLYSITTTVYPHFFFAPDNAETRSRISQYTFEFECVSNQIEQKFREAKVVLREAALLAKDFGTTVADISMVNLDDELDNCGWSSSSLHCPNY
jgi:hypothetical protein